MRKVEAVYKGVMAWLTGGSLFICFIVVFASSLSRYAFNSPFQWSEELAKFSMIYGTVFGATLAYMSGTQVRFAALLHVIPQHWVRWIELVSDVAILVLGFALTVSGYLFMIKRGGIMASGLNIQMYYPQAAMMLGGISLFIAAGLRLIQYLVGNGNQTEDLER